MRKLNLQEPYVCQPTTKVIMYIFLYKVNIWREEGQEGMRMGEEERGDRKHFAQGYRVRKKKDKNIKHR